jgi:hypothetical protein
MFAGARPRTKSRSPRTDCQKTAWRKCRRGQHAAAAAEQPNPVGSNPRLLHEERKKESFDPFEEVFEKWSWVPEQYVKLGPDLFMQRYCW